MTTALEFELQGLIDQITTNVRQCDVYFQEAAAKFVVRQLCWAFVDEDGSLYSHELADHLEVLAESVRVSGRAPPELSELA